MQRNKFQFSNAAAQRAEARLNLKEALAALARLAPPVELEPTTAAGACFRRVTRILAGQEGK